MATSTEKIEEMAAGLRQLQAELGVARQDAAEARQAAERAAARAQAAEEAASRPGARTEARDIAADVNATLRMIGKPENYDGTHAKWRD